MANQGAGGVVSVEEDEDGDEFEIIQRPPPGVFELRYWYSSAPQTAITFDQPEIKTKIKTEETPKLEVERVYFEQPKTKVEVVVMVVVGDEEDEEEEEGEEEEEEDQEDQEEQEKQEKQEEETVTQKNQENEIPQGFRFHIEKIMIVLVLSGLALLFNRRPAAR